jgi:hypothetical protein
MAALSSLLRVATIVTELLGLGLTVWLGLALVAFAPRRASSWLAASLFWGFSLVFALNLLQLGRPLVPEQPWLPYDLLRWILVPLPLMWLWLGPEVLPRPMHPLLRHLRRVAVALSFGLAVATALVGPWTAVVGLEARAWQWVFYPLYLFTVLVLFGPLLVLARRAARLTRVPAHRAAQRAFFLATALVILAALYRVGSFWRSQELSGLPSLPGDVALLVAVVALGAALVLRRIGEGETNAPAFIYSLTNAAAISVVYTLVVGGVAALLKISWVVLIPVVPLAVATHWLTDWSRSLFDTFFYRTPVQRLRADLRTLIRALDRDEALEPQLRPVVARLANQVRAAAAAVVLVEAESDSQAARWVASYPAGVQGGEVRQSSLLLARSAPVNVPPPEGIETGPAWAVPLMGAAGQVGTLVVWSDVRRGFSDLDLALLDEAGGQLAPLLVAWEAQSRGLDEIEGLVARYREQVEAFQAQVQALSTDESAEPEMAEVEQEARVWVEEALRNLHNVAYLGQHPLARTRLVTMRVAHDGDMVTHLERGQTVRQLCEELIERLRPPGPEPSEPYPSEWRLHTVLHAAYIEGEPNREIMSRLYIGEGTFHRARRQALASLAGALVELEQRARTE